MEKISFTIDGDRHKRWSMLCRNRGVEKISFTMRNPVFRKTRMINKGYTKDGFTDKVYHINLRYTGENDELYFRDYLNEHTQIA